MPKLMRMPSVIHTPLVQFSPLLSGQPVFPLLRCFIIALGQRWRWGVCLVATALNRPAVRIFGVPLTDRLFSFSLPASSALRICEGVNGELRLRRCSSRRRCSASSGENR